MIYWFAVDPDRPDELEVGLRNSLWGVPDERWDRIEPVEPGDSVLFYHRDHGFVLCDVDSEPYTESIPVWADVDYPHRIRLSDPVETDRYVNLGELFDCLRNRETGEPFDGVAEAEAALGGEGGMFRPLTDDEVRCLFGRLGWTLPAGVSPPPEPEEAERAAGDDAGGEAGEEEDEPVVAEPPAAAVRGRRVILAPAAGNTASQERYAETITEGVELDLLEDFLPEAQMEVLREALGSGQAHVWGTPPAQDHANRTQWEASGPGDVILFTGGGHVFASASVILTRLDEELAEELWGRREDGTTWKFLYFVTAPVEQEVPYDELNSVAGYEPAYRIPRLNVLAPERSGRVLEAFPDFAISRPPAGEDEGAAVAAEEAPEDEEAAVAAAETPEDEAEDQEAVAAEGPEPEPTAEPQPGLPEAEAGEEVTPVGQAAADEGGPAGVEISGLEEGPEDAAAGEEDGEEPGQMPAEGEAPEAEAREPEAEPGPVEPAAEEAPQEDAEADEGVETPEAEVREPEAEPGPLEPAAEGAPQEEPEGEPEPAPEPTPFATEPIQEEAPEPEPADAAGRQGPAPPTAEAEAHLPRIRDHLFGQRDLRRCGLCGRLLPVDLLEVVFIKPLEACTEIETMDLENDVMPACGLGCAALFREGFVVVDDGEVAAGRSDPRTDPVEEYVEELAGNQCEFWHAGSEGYFRWHAREIGGT